MRAAVTVIALALIVVMTTAASAQDQNPQPDPTPAVVSVAVTTADVRDGSQTRTDVLLVWNRNERSRPIGNGVKACIKAGSGGLLGGGLMSCALTLNLPLGKVTASGTVHSLSRYTLVITGGTGAYKEASGPLFVRRIGEGLRRLTFST